MKKPVKLQIPRKLLIDCELACGSKFMAITDFQFSSDKEINSKTFIYCFTLVNDAEMIAIEAGLRGYNDNLS